MTDYSNDTKLDPNEDYVVRLSDGEGVWIAVESDYGAKVVKLSVDIPTGGLLIRTWNPGKEDEEPNSEILELFA